jgi:hypothetical protein
MENTENKRSTYELDKDFPADIKTLADAASIHYKGVSKLWTVASAIGVVVVVSSPDQNGSLSMFGISMNENYFYVTAAFVLCCLNIAYCSVHLQAYRVNDIFAKRLEEYGAKSISYTQDHALSDTCHALYAPTLIRLYPISIFLPKILRIGFKHFKLLADVVFFSAPMMGVVAAARHLDWLQVSLILPLFVISLVCSISLGRQAFDRWKVFTG